MNIFFHLFSNYILLAVFFVFNFLIPGYVVIESFFHKNEKIFKLPMYFILSILFSTNLIYLFSLIFGFNVVSIYLSYLFWFLWLILLLIKRRFKVNIYNSRHRYGYMLSFVIFLIYIFVLNKSIFNKYQNYFVMSADNWQDTALHFSIIESLKEGNFPPQAPYFSGEKLKYHYFTDLHTAILTYPFYKFMPRIIIFDNSLFAFIFSLSIYSFVYFITKNRFSSFTASFLSVFSGSLIYLNLVRDYINNMGTIKELILTGSYVLDYGKLMQMAPMPNYFLQNRPMMIGLISIVVSIYLFFLYLKNSEKKYFVLLLFIAFATINFQIFCFLIILFFALLLIIKSSYRKLILLSLFILPIIYGFRNYINLFILNFNIGPWVDGKNVFWFVKFLTFNLGVPFMLLLIFIFLILIKKIKLDYHFKFLLVFFFTLILVPLICSFTIDRADMLKFFYISYIPMSIISAVVLERIVSKKYGIVLVLILVLLSAITGIVDLLGSYWNKNIGYSDSDLTAGLWIRNNTPQLSVFITNPTIHSPVTDIGGRLRVLSYTNWPYTHGYNFGDDNVFSRQSDIELFFNNINSIDISIDIVKKYNIDYVYLGPDESSNFLEAENKLKSNSQIEKVYDQSSIKIYKFSK